MRGWLLRVGFVYWMAICVPLILSLVGISVLAWPGEMLWAAMTEVDVWFAHHVLGIDAISTVRTNSGDRLIDWVHHLDLLVIAVIAATVWVAFDRRRAHDARLRALLRIALRYAAGFALLAYGLDKVCALQFQVPDDGQLMQRWGDSSRMNVLWTFMGTSTAYQVFTGAAETLGAALLLFRRTTTLGALLLVAVMSNVVMLNLCYDVAVKLDAAHLLAMCIVLPLPEAGRLVDMFVRHRAIPALPPDPPIARRSWRIARWVVKGIAIGLTLASISQWTVSAYQRRRTPTMAHHWAVGSWHVAAFERNGSELADGDGARWDRVRITAYGDELAARWWFPRGMSASYKAAFDDTAQVVKLEVEDDDGTGPKTGPLAFTFEHDPHDAARLALRGQVGADTLRIVLVHDDTSHMILRTRGFRWISDAQFDP